MMKQIPEIEEFSKLPIDGKIHTPLDVGYEKPTTPISVHPLWAIRNNLNYPRDKNSKTGQLMSHLLCTLMNKKLCKPFLK